MTDCVLEGKKGHYVICIGSATKLKFEKLVEVYLIMLSIDFKGCIIRYYFP